MAVDEGLSEIYRSALNETPGLTERKMMGGVCFLVNGNMLGGAHREKDGAGYFMFRVGKENTAAAEKIGGGEVMKQGGRVMSGLYFVEADDCSDALFEKWKSLALSHVLSLPPK
ncbi:TfoX/Sxy family protein [Altererythrobacter sp.]|uniref:TfoX/Sxy family protein n=1 Tax=Altererythrobacter sp. TaxID=1872480 RepID=UPI003D135587